MKGLEESISISIAHPVKQYIHYGKDRDVG